MFAADSNVHIYGEATLSHNSVDGFGGENRKGRRQFFYVSLERANTKQRHERMDRRERAHSSSTYMFRFGTTVEYSLSTFLIKTGVVTSHDLQGVDETRYT